MVNSEFSNDLKFMNTVQNFKNGLNSGQNSTETTKVQQKIKLPKMMY